MKVIINKLFDFYNNHIKPWNNFFVVIIIFMSMGFLIGLFAGNVMGIDFYKEDRNILLIMSVITNLVIFINIYHKQYCIKNHIETIFNRNNLKYVYFSITFFMFCLYYYINKENFINTYTQNELGIEQSQYIFITNFIGYLVITVILFYIVFNNYSIKKIGKSGIEFHVEQSVIKEHNELVNIYAEIIDNFSDHLCNIDNLMSELDNNNLIRDDYTLDEFIILIEDFLSSFMQQNNDLSIIVIPYDNFEHYGKTELYYNLFTLNKIKVNMYTNSVYVYNNVIFIKYPLSLLNNSILVIVNCDRSYPSGLGILIYSYLITLETSYSRYL